MKLIVSLPDNDLELAQAAAKGGADAVKVHMNVLHRASGAAFGDFAHERQRVLKLISDAGVPVGLMPGQTQLPTLDELGELIDAGLAFVDIYAHHLPASYLRLGQQLELILAIEKMQPKKEVAALTELEYAGKRVVEMLEAAIVPPEDYGTPLSTSDVAKYHALARMSKCPLLTPTQKAITPDDLPSLHREGIGGIMIGVIVTGSMAGGIEKATREFRNKMDQLAGE